VRVEVHGRHEAPGLKARGRDKGAKVGLGERDGTGGDGVAAGEVGEIRAEGSGGHGAAHGVATDAGGV